MSGDIAAASSAANGFLKTWDEGGRSQCLEQLISLSSQPSNSDDIRATIQSLVNALIKSDGFRLSPDDLAGLYGDLVLSQPSSSSSPEHLVIHQMLLDSIGVVDDILEDRAMAREALQKEKDKDASQQKEVKEKPRHRVVPERQPLVDFVRRLIGSNILSHDLCALNLDYGLLQDIGILRDSGQINGKEVRARTRLIYRQTKVNLLREQSEGYSKFIIELCNSLGPSQESLPSNPAAFLAKNCQQVVERLMKVAGYFDLDPTRMLDLVMDVFSTHVMTHYSFFIQLVRQFVSSRVRLLSEPHKVELMQTDQRHKYTGVAFDEIIKVAEGEVSVMPSGELKNPLAQLMGFKFAYYESIAQNLPQNLVFAAALLIREGLMSIEDLFDHLSPSAEGIDALGQKHEDEMKKRIRLAKTTAADKENALANAPVLSQSDDRDYGSRRPPPSQAAQAAAPVKPIKEPRVLDELNQHRDLTVALLSVGALRPALFLITKQPWLISRCPQLADILLKQLEHSIDPVYRKFSPRSQDPGRALVYSKGLKAVEDGKSPKTKHTMTFPVPPASTDIQQVFFFQQWAERIPICQSTEELPFIVDPFLKIVGVHAYRSLPLFLKLCRIARAQFVDEASEETRRFWVDMIRVHFLPLISMSKDNALLGMELWPILQKMEQPNRWSIYAEWLQRTYEHTSEMRLKKALVTRECKGVLRRLSSKNQGQSARAFAKIAHHNPCVVFNIAIGQVMSYDNLADPLIEALRTLTPIGYDILTFCLLDAFADPDRPRMKDDGTNVAHWLQSLASLTAHLCRRYSLIDPTPILQFTAHRLYNDSPPDAIILREMISKMCGIDPLQLLADNQVAAMGGGPVLQIETVASEARGALQTKPLQRSADKLLTVMSTANLMLPTLLLLAQQCQQCIYQGSASDAILKGLSSMYDDLRGIFFQYITFLSLSPVSQKATSTQIRADFFNNFPSLAEVVEQYNMDPMMVIHICRPPMQRTIVEQAVAESKGSKAVANVKEESPVEVEARLRAQIAATRENGVDEVNMQVDSEATKPWLPVLQPWIDSVEKVLPPRVNELMGAPFFVTFWQLTLLETVSLVGHYKEHLQRITKLADDHARTETAANKSSRDRSIWNDKKERLNSFKESLVKESNDHLIIYAATKKRLAQERLHWFNDTKEPQELLNYIIQYCLFPRVLLSPMDADFVAQFIKILHNLGTKGFWTLGCYNTLLSENMGSVVFSCTQNEARNYGRFLRGVLRDLAAWYKDEALYTADSKKSNTGLPGFAKHATLTEPATWVDFRKFVIKIHKKLCSAMVACLTGSSGEFMHVSNAILVLKEILPVFPQGTIHHTAGVFIDQALQELLATEKRGDIKILATSYQGQLRMVKKEWEIPSEQATSMGETRASTRANGHTSAPVGPKGVTPGNAPNASASTRPAPRQSVSNTPITHPLPANPARSRPIDGTADSKPFVERPQVIKRINREAPVARENDEMHTQVDSAEKVTSRLQALDVADSTARHSPRAANGQPLNAPKDAPLGPRNPTSRGHRLAEDPSSRPPPSASMPPPRGPSNTASAQELRASTTQQPDRARLNPSEKDIFDSRTAAEARRSDIPRTSDSSRGEPRRRSQSPARIGAENGADARRREDDRRSGRDEHRRTDRRPGREEERDRDRDKDRRGERERESRRERESTTRTASRSEDPNRTPGSPHRADDASGRKRPRDPREEDPSDRNSKRPNRERDKEKERDRRERSTRDKEKDHRHRERRRERDETNSSGASPRDGDREGKAGPPSAPSGPRAMLNENDKSMLANVVRRERDPADTPPHRSQSNNVPPSGSSSSRSTRHRDDRTSEPFPPSAASLVSRIAESSLPPRPAQNVSRDNADKLERESQRKRTVSARSQDELAGGGSTTKRFKIDRNK